VAHLCVLRLPAMVPGSQFWLSVPCGRTRPRLAGLVWNLGIGSWAGNSRGILLSRILGPRLGRALRGAVRYRLDFLLLRLPAHGPTACGCNAAYGSSIALHLLHESVPVVACTPALA